MIRLDRMPMTPLRRRFIDDLLLRNYAVRTIETNVTGVVRVAKCFRRSPEFLGPDDLMQDEDLGEILALARKVGCKSMSSRWCVSFRSLTLAAL